MTIEHLIFLMATKGCPVLNQWDVKVIVSLANQTQSNLALTEKQANLSLRILKRYKTTLKTIIGKEVDPFLDNPTYNLPLRELIKTTKLSIFDHMHLGKVVKAVFPYDETILQSIRNSKNTNYSRQWDSEEKCWYFPLNEQELIFIFNLFKDDNIELSEELKDYKEQIKEIHKNVEQYLPILCKDQENHFFVKNAPKNLPEILAQHEIAAFFEARRKGIYVWDESLDDFLNSDQVRSTTRDFLKHNPSEVFLIDSQKHQISEISDILSNLLPAMIVIPGGSELEKMTLAYNFLNSLAIRDEEISVMFRLPSETDKEFNDFIKKHNLNNGLSDKTKIVVVSSKIPKPIFKQKIKFSCIINLGHGNVHYTMRDFVEKHENLVYFSIHSNQGVLNFGIM